MISSVEFVPVTAMPLPAEILDLALQWKLDPQRVETFATTKQLKERAAFFEVSEADWRNYGDHHHGLRIQIDELPRGPDYRILIRDPLPGSAFPKTCERLGEVKGFYQLRRVPQFSSAEPQKLSAFLLLHEIAHWELGHLKESKQIELAADRWAIERLPERWWPEKSI